MFLLFLFCQLAFADNVVIETKIMEVMIEKDGAQKTVEVLVEKNTERGVNAYFQGDKSGFLVSETDQIELQAMIAYFNGGTIKKPMKILEAKEKKAN
jgi:hypothetical protein